MRAYMNFYRYIMHVKFHMAIYAVLMICLKGALDYLGGLDNIDTMIVFEMILVALVIAFFEAFIFPEGKDFEKSELVKRSACWAVGINIIVIGAANLLNWFENRPTWHYIVLIVLIETVLVLMWIGIHVAERLDTKSLNEGLKNLQK